MDTNMIGLLISLASGALGGSLTGSNINQQNSLGAVGNTLTGLLGGGLGHVLLQALGLLTMGSTELTMSAILSNFAIGGVSGAVFLLGVGFIKNALFNK